MTYATKIVEAKNAGYTDDEILAHLAMVDARVKQARDAGHTAEQILGFLAAMPERQPAPTAADVQDVPRAGLNTRDREVAEAMAFDPANKAYNRETEAVFADRNAAELDASLRNARDPAIRATLEAERNRMPARSTQADVRRAEPAEADVAAAMPEPAPRRTLDDMQAEREGMEKQDEVLKRRERELDAVIRRGTMPNASAASRQAKAVAEEERARVQAARQELQAAIDQTGVGTFGRNVGATAGGIAGGLLGTPGGLPGIIGGGMAGAAIGSAGGSAYDLSRAARNAVEVTPEEARDMIVKGALVDAAFDGAGSLIFFGGGHAVKLLSKDPKVMGALRRLILERSTASRAATARATGDEAAASIMDEASTIPIQRSARTVQASTDQEKAVQELVKRTGGEIPTEGQITGTAGRMETAARAMQPEKFEPARQALEDAARQMHRETVNPLDQPTSKQFGVAVDDLLKRVETTVKKRTEPVFTAARNANVEVDARPVAKIMEDLLARDAQSTGLLKGSEKAFLEGEVRKLHTRMMEDLITAGQRVATSGPASPAFAQLMQSATPDQYGNMIQELLVRNAQLHGQLITPGERAVLAGHLKRIANREYTYSAEGAIDTLSSLKRRAREMTQEGAPSEEFSKRLGQIVGALDSNYDAAARGSGNAGLANALRAARDDYRGMMGTVFDDEMSRAMRARPEEVGKLIWARGHVSGPEQLQAAMQLAKKEGLMKDADIAKMNADVLRGFLQGAAPDVSAAAKWTETLAKDPAKRESFELLTRQTGTKQIAEAMRVLEQAAKISQRGLPQEVGLGQAAGIVSRAHAGTLGMGYTTGVLNVPLLAVGMIVQPLTSAYATAITQGNKGIYRDLLLLTKGVGNLSAAARGPIRAAYGRVAKWAAENNIELFEATPSISAEEGQ